VEGGNRATAGIPTAAALVVPVVRLLVAMYPILAVMLAAAVALVTPVMAVLIIVLVVLVVWVLVFRATPVPVVM
jgi:hypothetical protein